MGRIQRYKDARIRMDRIRKAKAQMELNLSKNVKKYKSFYRYVGQKKKNKDVALYINKTEAVTTGMEKAEVLSIFFPQLSLVITLPTSLKSLNLKAGNVPS